MNNRVLAALAFAVLVIAIVLAQPGGMLDRRDAETIAASANVGSEGLKAPRAEALEEVPTEFDSLSDDDLLDDATGIAPIPEIVFEADGSEKLSESVSIEAESSDAKPVQPDVVPTPMVDPTPVTG